MKERYNIGLEPVSKPTLIEYLDLYLNHYGVQAINEGEVIRVLMSYYAHGRLSHFACAKRITGEIVCAMGVCYTPEDDAYIFSHLVTHADHRKQGLAKQIIMTGAKMLMLLEPRMIRNHKRMNVIPVEYFHEMGFEEENIPLKGMPEYTLRYTWRNPNNGGEHATEESEGRLEVSNDRKDLQK